MRPARAAPSKGHCGGAGPRRGYAPAAAASTETPLSRSASALRRLLRLLRQCQCGGDGPGDEGRIGEGSQVHEADTIPVSAGSLLGYLEGETGLADAARPGEGDQARSGQPLPALRDLPLAAHEAAQRVGQGDRCGVWGVGCSGLGGGGSGAELVEEGFDFGKRFTAHELEREPLRDGERDLHCMAVNGVAFPVHRLLHGASAFDKGADGGVDASLRGLPGGPFAFDAPLLACFAPGGLEAALAFFA